MSTVILEQVGLKWRKEVKEDQPLSSYKQQDLRGCQQLLMGRWRDTAKVNGRVKGQKVHNKQGCQLPQFPRILPVSGGGSLPTPIFPQGSPGSDTLAVASFSGT